MTTKPDVLPTTTVRQIWTLLEANKIKEAVTQCQTLNRQHPDFAEGWHVASHAAERARLPNKSLEFIERALSLDADNSGYLMQKASIFRRTGRMAEGLQIASQLVGRRLTSAAAYNMLGSTLAHFDLHEEALLAIDEAIAMAPDRAHYYFNRAAELRFLGRLQEAESACDRCIALNPLYCEAHLMRSDLRRQTERENHVDELQALLPKATSDWRGQSQLHFALAKELEDLGEYQESFVQRQSGASLRRQHMRYSLDHDLDTMRAITEVFDGECCKELESNCEDDSPIFVIGLPRTGTTLLERILDSHSEVHSAGELNNFAQELTRLAQSQFSKAESRLDFVRQSAKLNYTELGRAYIESTAALNGNAARFVDKLPLNYLYAGLIHRALPNARIIHLRRHPVAACYSIYKQLFHDAYPFSYSLEELAQYYLAYDRLMSHWRALIPETAMTELRYEDLVTDTEQQARRILIFCDVEWQDRCLAFHEQKSASTTASAAQVRQPVYTRSVDLWRNYQTQLQPLIEILTDGGISEIN